MKERTSEEINATVTERFKEELAKSGFTDEYIAKNMNISPERVEELKTGKSPLNAQEAVDFCKILGISLDYICGAKDSLYVQEIDCTKLNHLGNRVLHTIYKELVKNKMFSAE